MLSQQLKTLIKGRNLSLQELAEKANIPVESVRNIYYGKVKDPKISTLMRISRVFNVSVNYLMGESLYTKDEEDIIRHYRKCGSHGKSIIQLVARYEANTTKKEREGAKHKIPCIIPAGKIKEGFTYMSTENETIEVETDVLEAFISIEITSNVYAPLIVKGDRVLLADRYPEHGERAVFIIDGKGYFRQLIEHDAHKIELRGLTIRTNDTIPTRRLDEIECLGTWVGVIRT